ncbi:MAG: hypothetical protein OEV58_15875, partial [Gammaproteobacteria bacterium]|nr:hypothetical protein [Gammaproteobacteria bacterium]
MMRPATILILLTLYLPYDFAAAQTCATLDGAYVYSQESLPVYLGFFGNQFAIESISNQFGTYGSEFSNLSVC